MDGGVQVILVWLIAIPLLGGVVAWVVARWSAKACRAISLGCMMFQLAVALSVASIAGVNPFSPFIAAGRGDSPWMWDIAWSGFQSLG